MIRAEDSTTYQAILQKRRIEGRIIEARRMLFILGIERFGVPNSTTEATLEAIEDIDRVRTLLRRIGKIDIQDWDGLVGTP